MSSHPMHLPPYGETNVLIVRKNKMQSAESIQLIAFWLIASLITVSSTQEVKNIGQDVKRILLEYNFAGDDSSWFTRGTLVISSDKVTSLPSYTLTDEQYSQLKEAALKKADSLVKIRARSEKEPLESSRYSFVKACSLYQSSLSDLISLYFDSTGSFMGLSVATYNPHCSVLTDVPLKSFNSTVEVYSTTSGPLPDTQTYLLRLEQEKHEKLRGEKGDNRSFLAKYWMYIVPLVVFMLISGTSTPEGEAAS